jgi:hypothetical protein
MDSDLTTLTDFYNLAHEHLGSSNLIVRELSAALLLLSDRHSAILKDQIHILQIKQEFEDQCG